MKKGFTLIELLAVIVILAIIALIASPIVINIINDARENAAQETFNNIKESVKLYIAKGLLNPNISNNFDGTTNVFEELEYDGGNPAHGIVYINRNNEIAIAVLLNDTCYTQGYSDTEVIKSNPVNGECSLGYDIVSKDINITPSGFSFTGMELLTTSQLGTLYPFLLANGDPESYNSKYLEEVTSEASLGNGKIIGNFSNYEDDYIILKINIPTGTKVLDLSFNLIPFNNNGRSKQTFRIIPQAASSYDDLLNYHLLNNGSYKVQYLPKNNETSIIFVYKYWNSSSTNCEMSNLNITYGGLETGDNAFVLSGQPFVDNGFSNKNGTNIPFENDMLVDSDLVTPLVNGIYTNTYEIDTISGPLEFTRNIFVGYESLFDITSEQLYAKYIPHGYTATIVGTTYNGEDNVNLTLKTGDAFSGICYSNLTLTLNNGISNVYSTSVQILNPC